MRFGNFIVTGIAVLLAAWALRDTAVAIWLSADTAGPPVLVRGDPRVELGALDVEFLPDGVPTANKASQVVDHARAVLRSAPIEVSAMRDLALVSQQRGDPTWLDQLTLAERLSRRDVPTQNAFLREAAKNNQYGPALNHLDRILTVAPDMEPQFVDAMAALVEDPQGRRVLTAYGRRPWFPVFAAQAIVLVGDPRDTAALLTAARLAPTDAAPLGPALLARLVASREYAAARAFAVHFAGATPAALDDFGLTPATADPKWAPLSWWLTASVDITPHLTSDGRLETEVRSGASAPVAERITLLAPGDYTLEQQVGANEAARYLRLRWEMSCQAADGSWAPPAWQQQVPPTSRPTRYRTHIVLPADCHAQQWRLIAAVDDTQLTPMFQLANLSLKPS